MEKITNTLTFKMKIQTIRSNTHILPEVNSDKPPDNHENKTNLDPSSQYLPKG